MLRLQIYRTCSHPEHSAEPKPGTAARLPVDHQGPIALVLLQQAGQVPHAVISKHQELVRIHEGHPGVPGAEEPQALVVDEQLGLAVGLVPPQLVILHLPRLDLRYRTRVRL